DFRLPTGKLILVRKGELDCGQFKGVKHLGGVRQVLCIRMQDVGELAMMFEQDKTFSGDPIYRRPSAKDSTTDADVTRLNQPSDAPVKAVSGTIRAAELHQLKQLAMADEPRIADLTQERDVALRIDDQTTFGVTHER